MSHNYRGHFGTQVVSLYRYPGTAQLLDLGAPWNYVRAFTSLSRGRTTTR
jgi:hypothetical protein